MGDLTTIANVKAVLGITDSSQDTILARLVSAASARIERAIGRTITQTTYTAEGIDSIGVEEVLTSAYPIISLTSISEAGVTLSAADYSVEASAGIILRMSGGLPIAWAVGKRVVVATYVAGYATVPADLVDAATQQAAFEWRKTRAGGDRLGLVSQAIGPGTGNYIVDAWAPGVEETVRAYRRMR